MNNLSYAALCGLLVAGIVVGAPDASAQTADSSVSAAAASTAVPKFSIPIDNFEDGVTAWTHNDKTKAGLSDITATAPGAPLPNGAGTSKSKALMTFKSATASWASLSRPVDGASWASIGARELVFSLTGSGDTKGVDLQLRAKSADGDLVYALPLPVKINNTTWRTVVVPLSEFKNAKGQPITEQISNIYLLQFAQSGDWNSRFFSVDNLLVRGNGTPIVPKVLPVIAPATPALPAGAVAVNVDFKRLVGNIRASANVSVVAPYDATNTQSLELSQGYREALSTLGPKFVRLDVAALADLTDSSRPAFNFARLVSAVKRARAVGAEPLIAISNPNEWGLDAKGYGVLAAAAARALNPSGSASGGLARYFEMACWSNDTKTGDAVAFYNAGYSGIKGVSARLIVGGYGAPAGDVANQSALLKGARGLDFLSSRYYSANSGTPSDSVLLADARTVTDLKTAAGLLDKSRFKRAPLYVTSANLSNARNGGDFVPSDNRLIGPVAGAWWAQFMGSGSRLADQIFHNDATNPEWGLLLVQSKAQAFPAYYSMYLWNTYFADGTQRVVADSANDAVYVAATNTKTAHNLLLVNTTALPQVAQVGIRGFPTLRQVRMHTNDDPSLGIRTIKLPNSPFQTLRLLPYSVNVVQFIEPPQ